MAAKKRQAIRPVTPALSPKKRLAFRLLAVTLPVVVLGLAEVALRVVGYGGYPPMLQRVGPVDGGDLIMAPP